MRIIISLKRKKYQWKWLIANEKILWYHNNSIVLFVLLALRLRTDRRRKTAILIPDRPCGRHVILEYQAGASYNRLLVCVSYPLFQAQESLPEQLMEQP